MPSTGFALQGSSSTCPPLVLSITMLPRSQELSPALLVRWGCDSAPCLGVGKLGSRENKTIHSNQAYLYPTKFSAQRVPPTWFCRRAKLLVGLLLGHSRYELGLPRPMCWLFQAPPPPLSWSDSHGVRSEEKDGCPTEEPVAQARPLFMVLCFSRGRSNVVNM